jgi:hypothetical protein
MFNEITIRLFVDSSKIDIKEFLKIEAWMDGKARLMEAELGDVFFSRKLALDALSNIANEETYESTISHDYDDEDEELVDASDYATMALSHIAWAKKLSEGSSSLQLNLL